jgi:hypothetical protein
MQPFSHSIRRSAAHSPEGSISINEVTNDFTLQPIHTFKNTVPTPSTMTFALSSSSKVTIAGKRYLHMYLSHAFSNEMLPTTLTLTAQTKQFSSFLLVIGRVSSSEFDATYAMIIKDKDEITIPLQLAVIPTLKEFNQAISALSSTQQEFAKAIRTMQLEGTV